ncbi:hypothetical protein J6X04_01675 [Candidatus Saccharibacteria bacterium]|nr:hypothetical protein [Candidatus Saccharibacteria bacterium]
MRRFSGLFPVVFTALFLLLIFNITFDASVFALTYNSNVEVGFTFNPTISVNLSGDLLINNLSPGSVSDSNTINVNVSTNASQGYVLTATSGTKTTNTDLVNQTNSAYKFSSIATNASLSNLTTDNTWGFSYSEDSGTNWSNYSGLPLDNDDEGATGKQLINTINPADNRTLQFKIAARAANNQAAGTYMNTINFYAVANPDPTLQPVSCPAGKICYNANSLTTVQGEMGQQSASNGASTALWASNFKRDGYGFAGWADSTTYNGLRYGPNQTITAPSDISTNGYSLYAIWIPSAGDMQNWTGCSSMSQGEVTALKDVRDNDVYAVAKLADGKCWMIENLRLDDSATLTSANTHNPSLPLTNVYDATNPTTSNHLSSTTNPYQTAWCKNNNSSCMDQSIISTNNTTLFASNTASNYDENSDVYGYGNYYNWYSATAGYGKWTSGSDFVAPGDICPSNWHLPTGGSPDGEFRLFDVSLGGPGAYISDNVEDKWRSYPNNFVYSGSVDGSIIRNRNSYGHYWSSSAKSNYYAHALYFYNGHVDPGTYYNVSKYFGRTVRCIAGT